MRRVDGEKVTPECAIRLRAAIDHPALYDGDAGRYSQAAVASTWRTTPGGKELFFRNWRDYQPAIET